MKRLPTSAKLQATEDRVGFEKHNHPIFPDKLLDEWRQAAVSQMAYYHQMMNEKEKKLLQC